MKFYSYCQTHWDREWYQPFEEFRLRLIKVFDEVLHELEVGNMSSFYFDGQTIALEDYLNIYPEKEELIKKLIKAKKLFIGPWYALADEFLVSGESLLRNLLIGFNQSKKFGCEDFTGYLPDTFGHVYYIPMLLNSFGINSTILWRGTGKLKSEFKWTSKDGSSVLALNLIEGYFIDILNADIDIKKKITLLKKIMSKIKKMSVSDVNLLPLGGDHLGPVKNLNNQLLQINSALKYHQIKDSSIFEYLEKIKQNDLNLKSIKTELRDNARSNLLSGVFSTRLYLKKQNMITEWKLRKLAEPLSAFLQENLSKNILDYAWKTLIKNHPHDSICGCSTDAVHREMMTRYEKVNQISDGLINRAVYSYAKNSGKNELVIFNASNYSYNGVIEIEVEKEYESKFKGQYLNSTKKFPVEILLDTSRPPYREDIKEYVKKLIYAENMLSVSFKTLKSAKIKEFKDEISITQSSIDNDKVFLSINNDGTLNITDKETGKIYKNIHCLQNKADIGDTYNFCPIKEDKGIFHKFVKTEIVEKGTLRSTLKIIYSLDIPEKSDFSNKARSKNLITHSFYVYVSLSRNSKRLDFKIEFENKSENHLLQLVFNTGSKVKSTISEEGFGLIKREFNPDYDIKDFMPAKRPDELKTNTAPMQRFVWANGLGLIAEGLTEYEVCGNNLSLTLLRAVGILSQGPMDTRSVAAGPPIETPEAQCLGKHSFRYALFITEKPVELFKESDFFMGNILSMQGKGNKSLNRAIKKCLSVNNPNIYICAVKQPENLLTKGIIVRLCNLSNRSQSFNIKSDLSVSRIRQVNSLEESLGENICLTEKISIKAFELKTFLIT